MTFRGNASFTIYSASFSKNLRKVHVEVANVKKKRETGEFTRSWEKLVSPERSIYNL